ncbi:MAG: SUMF1/EgtB/PvdO family nonheme iron enzyme [Planctomycetes bacterium]|nr:SUMF1/EgtB/PvdO family nonheme iron enzyme [Planctomycetota bacterium]
MADAAPTPAPRAKRVFVAYDFQNRSFRSELSLLTDPAEHPPGVFIDIPGLEEVASGQLWKAQVEPRIRNADAVLALVDSPNANVCFEIGFALGLGLPVRLMCHGENFPEWASLAPLTGQLIANGVEFAKVKEHAALAASASERHLKIHLTPVTPPKIPFRVLALGWSEGSAMSSLLQKGVPAECVIRESPATLEDLPSFADGISKLIWIPTMRPAKEERLRHGIHNSSAAILAGFAMARKADLQIWLGGKGIDPDEGPCFEAFMDVAHLCRESDRWSNAIELKPKLAALVEAPAQKSSQKPEAILARYRSYLTTKHSKLVTLFPEADLALLQEKRVAIEEMRGDGQGLRAGHLGSFERSVVTLEELLLLPRSSPSFGSGRWVLIGEPGAGKSTLARDLCRKLAAEPAGPIPIFVRLSTLAGAHGGLFDLIQSQCVKDCSESEMGSLAKELQSAASSDGALWILLDGLDEVADYEGALSRIEQLAADYPAARILVTTRSAGYDRKRLAKNAQFRHATLERLRSDESRKRLLRSWVPQIADSVWNQIESQPALYGTPEIAGLSENPLMLMLLAYVASGGGEGAQARVPRTRVQLYERTIDRLLRKSFEKRSADGVTDPVGSARVLEALSLDLHEDKQETWTLEELESRLTKLVIADPETGERVRSAGGAGPFLEHRAQPSGILASLDGSSESWGYFHKSLREYLSAKRLDQQGEQAFVNRARSISKIEKDDERAARARHWAEVLALYTGLAKSTDESLRRLETLQAASEEVFLRVLPQVEQVPAEKALDLLWKTALREQKYGIAAWDGDYLFSLAQGWIRELGAEARTSICDLLWARVTTTETLERLAYIAYVLEELGSFDRARFFESAGRSLLEASNVRKDLALRRCPPTGKHGVFVIGTPEKDGGYESERPQPSMTLTAFLMSATTITQEQFQRILRSPEQEAHRSGHGARLPQAFVSWFEARLFTRWIGEGCDLPTEAQWEFACRAGSEGPWTFGDRESDLEQHAWYDKNSDASTHPVGTKTASGFGLHDMHGNVWEWCTDRIAPYPETANTDPRGPASAREAKALLEATNWGGKAAELGGGAVRVLRGGSFWDSADRCRSAYRYGSLPSVRSLLIGFRVCFPAAPAG